ncbi:MAG: NPCBM/NEW2 domain-containing protein [Saprospiraceae bacterium]
MKPSPSRKTALAIPPGVFVKHFELPIDYNNPSVTKRLETRFFVITQNGGGYGITYKWRDDGSDADLIIAGETKDIAVANGPESTQTWIFPSRTECMTCHNANADFVLGVKTWQLNGTYDYPVEGGGTITDNQLNTWQHLGMFANPFNPAEIPSFLQSKYINDASASLEVRVRSYLDANCSHCHRPGGVEGAFDARFSTPIEDQNIVKFYGISRNTHDDHFIVKPKYPAESELWIRDGGLGANAMPPIAKNIVHDDYMAVLTEWINGLDEEVCYPAAVSSLIWSLPPENQVGPIEINTSNGDGFGGDGNPITINGVVFEKGLGVHANSSITYNIRGLYSVFETYIGMDDETDATCNQASARFEVYLDGNLAYQSTVMNENDDARFVRLNVIGVQELKLVVNDAGNGQTCDHADWANPTLFPCVDCVPGTPCDDGNDCTINDQLDAICDCVGTLIDSDGDGVCDTDDICPGSDDTVDSDYDGIPDGCDDQYCPIDFVSDLNWVGTPINGSGSVKKDISNGNGVITIDGVSYDKGLGVHAHSEVTYDISGQGYETFLSYTGIDDECLTGAVIFEVYTDGNLVYQSPALVRGGDPAIPIAVDVTGVSELKLVVTAGNGTLACDHADWAYARLERCCSVSGLTGTACDDGDPCTIDDQYDEYCNCAGTLVTDDTDGDGVCDAADICPGSNDLADADGDGVPDGCDVCPGSDDTADTDGDGVPNGCDMCPGSDDTVDADGDGIPDGCDVCPGSDDTMDADGDGVPDGCDVCSGSDDTVDSDGDGVPDGCDICPGFDDSIDDNDNGIPDGCDDCITMQGMSCDDGDPCTVNDVYDDSCNCVGTLDETDSDGDGVCDTADQCPGFDDTVDTDGDGVPDGCDICEGADDSIDSDGDGVPDGCDICPAGDDSIDSDGDAVPDACDQCPGSDDALDEDGDNVPDGCDVCPGFVDGDDFDGDGVPFGCDKCFGFDDNLDADGDGVPDGCDQCPGFDDNIDVDDVGIPDGCDPCVGLTGLACDDSNPCTINDVYDENCNCAGTLTDDTDGDGVCDAMDQCPGFDDSLDEDLDNVPDGCDVCPGFIDGDDFDGDGVPFGCDKCPGFDDNIDVDNDGIPDGCDNCIGRPESICETGDCDLNDDPIPSGAYAADQVLSSTGVVEAGSNVVLLAGEKVSLKPGFRVMPGAEFRAMIVECAPAESSSADAGPDEILPPTIRAALVTHNTRITYTIPFAGEVTIQVIDLTGKILLTPMDATYENAGEHVLSFLTNLPPGLYYVRLQHKAGTVQDKLLLDKQRTDTSAFSGVVKKDGKLLVSIRPNPFRDDFRVYIEPPIPEMKRAMIRIADTSGRIIYQRFDAPFNQEISIVPHSGWVSGVYIMQVRASEYVVTHRLVKQ